MSSFAFYYTRLKSSFHVTGPKIGVKKERDSNEDLVARQIVYLSEVPLSVRL